MRFQPRASAAFDGLALIFDLAEFTKFLNIADAHIFAPRFLNRVIDAVHTEFFGGEAYWLPHQQVCEPLAVEPIHEKFLGDGALYIWRLPADEQAAHDLIADLSVRMWNLQHAFDRILDGCAEDIPVRELPPAIRFGIARGNVYELTAGGEADPEFMGPCINLASRLQKYCPELRFTASARVDLQKSFLTQMSFKKVVATQLRSFPRETVIVDEDEYANLPEEIRAEYFADLPGRPV